MTKWHKSRMGDAVLSKSVAHSFACQPIYRDAPKVASPLLLLGHASFLLSTSSYEHPSCPHHAPR